jgi:hypothetical protein
MEKSLGTTEKRASAWDAQPDGAENPQHTGVTAWVRHCQAVVVEKNKIADLVLLDENPLEDIRNTTKIRSVVFNGRLLDRKVLDQALAEIEAAAKK